jgi:hypothetical protein
MGINYRYLNGESEAEILQWLDLYRICYQHSVSREFWHWIHIDNPFYKKSKPLIFIAESEGCIVGSVSLFPSQLTVSDHNTDYTLESCLLCKAMVHPELRGQGIFSTLLKNAQKLMRDEGYDLILTFTNNPYTYRSFIHADFVYISEMVQPKIYISTYGPFNKFISYLPKGLKEIIGYPITCIYQRLLPNTAHKYQIQYKNVFECFEEIDKIHATYHHNYGIYGTRTSKFFRWRFSLKGVNFKCLSLWEGKKMLAYIIFEYPNSGKNALISDLFVHKGSEILIQILVSEAVVILKKDNLDSILTYNLERTWNLSKIFSFRHGFINRSLIVNRTPKSHFLFYLLNKKHPFPFFADKNNWNIQSADTCLFWGN